MFAIYKYLITKVILMVKKLALKITVVYHISKVKGRATPLPLSLKNPRHFATTITTTLTNFFTKL
jgi:hypothetical protein